MSSEMIKAVDGATGITALAIKAGATALPTRAEGYVDLTNRDVRAVRIKFGATRTAGDNETMAYQVNVWRRRGDLVTATTATYYDPEEVARGVATIGTKTYKDGDVDHYEVDTITQTLTTQPDVIVFSPAGDRTAWLVVACPDVLGVQVIFDRDAGGGTAVATCDAFVQVLQEADYLPFELLALVNTKVDTVDTVVDTLTTNLALVNGYTYYDGWRVAQKTITANPGVGGTDLFNVGAGMAEVEIVGHVTAAITGTGAETLTVLAPGGLVTLIAATTATDLAAGEIWHDNSPDATVELSSVAPARLVGSDGGVGTRAITLVQSGATAWTAGSLQIICRWRPVTVTIAVAP